MKKLFTTSALILLTVFTVAGILTELVLPLLISPNTYLAASADKQKRLRELPGNRIIITGGSNAAFSISGEMIGDTLDKPVVNMGLHAGLGIRYMLNETAADVRAGDLVLLVSEYYLSDGNLRLFAMASAANPDVIRYADLSFADLCRLYCYKLQICLRFIFYRGESLDNIYIRNGFNDTGDLISHLGIEPGNITKPTASVNWPDHYNEAETIRKFVSYCSQKGAKVVYMFPCFPESEFELNRQQINQFAKDLATQSECMIAGSPSDFVFPDSAFLDDGRYHLARPGREERTLKVIELLRALKIQ